MNVKKLIAISTMIVATNSYAIYPASCVVGTSSAGLTAEASTHIAVGVSTQYKGDYSYSIPAVNKRVVFYNDYDAYMGDSNTNSDSNAYINHTAFNRGQAWFWVYEDDDFYGGSCSAKQVYFQSLPTVNSGSASGGSRITTQFSGNIDNQYSERGRAGLPPKIKIQYHNYDYNKKYYAYPTSTTFNYSPRCDGEYKVTAYVDDGNFITSKVLATGLHYTGGTSCGNAF